MSVSKAKAPAKKEEESVQIPEKTPFYSGKECKRSKVAFCRATTAGVKSIRR